MDAGMAGLAERQEIIEVTGARGVVPDRVDVVGVEPPALSADHAPIPGAGVDARGLLTRPAADVGAFRRHSPLPEVRPLSTPRCPDDAEVLLRVPAGPPERPSLAPLHQPGESALFPTVELEPVPRKVLPHGMVGDAGVLGDGGDIEAPPTLLAEPVRVPMGQDAVHGERRRGPVPRDTAIVALAKTGGRAASHPALLREAGVILRHRQVITGLERHPV